MWNLYGVGTDTASERLSVTRGDPAGTDDNGAEVARKGAIPVACDER